MNIIKIQLLILSLISLFLTSCASTSLSGQIPGNGPSMSRVYKQAMQHSESNDLDKVRSEVNPTVLSRNESSATKIVSYNQNFKLMPNPRIQMYVYPHFAGRQQAPVPGYTTEFSMFNSIHYALPGEMGERE